MDSEVVTNVNETKSTQQQVVKEEPETEPEVVKENVIDRPVTSDEVGETVVDKAADSAVENGVTTTTTTTVVVIKKENAKEEEEADLKRETETTTKTIVVNKNEIESNDTPDNKNESSTTTTTTIVVTKKEPEVADISDKESKTSTMTTTTIVVASPKKEENMETEEEDNKDSSPSADGPSTAKETSNKTVVLNDKEEEEIVVEGEGEEESDDNDVDDYDEDMETVTKTEEIEDGQGQCNIPEKSEEAAKPKIDQDDNAVKTNKDINNQIEHIISDIDINIKAQEKITQLKEQELLLIQKQKELANQIQQQQLLAQKLIAENQLKEQDLQRQQYLQQQQLQQQQQQQSQHQYNEDCALKSKPDHYNTTTVQRQEVQESNHISRTVDLRKIFTPATDAPQILPKNHYQQYQANRPGPTSPSIVPAYSDAGKHRVQLNLHQDQLIEKYSKPGVQVVKSPWEAALQTGSASTAFLEQAQYRSQTPIVAQPSPVHFTQDFTDSPSLPASYANSSNYVNDSYKSSFDTRAKSQSIQSSNPQRELAYKPSVAQGWGGRNVELPREYYFQIQQQPEFEKHNFNDPRNSYYNGNEQLFVDPNAYGINMQFPQTDFNLNDDIHQRLQQLEQFQQCFMQQQMKQLKLKSNGNLPMAKCIGSMSSTNTKPIERSEVQQVVAEERSKAEEAGEPVNVRELIFTFEQQSLRERELTPNIQNELSSDKKRLPTLSLNTSKSSTNQMNDQDTIKGLYVPKEISLASYAPPPVQSTHNFQSSPKPMDYSAKEYELPSYPGFPISNLKPGLYNSVPPKEQLYNSTSYQKFPSSSVQAGPQVSFSPSPLSFDKLSKFQESPDQRNQRYFNGNKQPAYRGVQNVSPTPFLSGGAGGHNDRLPISSPTYGSNTSHNVGSQQGRGANQSFNNSARGWNKGTNNIQPNVYHPKTVSISATESLPYSDF
ncbi:RNA polymerase II degradation factor 1 isoform X3 [Drosophila hydei]|uniref:RNA polymerase II degradation factor 1 isoform X3 n=1 Tax=Drosophila hydei TaxID=7224 RepID=A0A6J2T0M4_DROHY|nr:RNA polymerase II degradation factor 1 isoform X3 [Drosophila hydei]